MKRIKIIVAILSLCSTVKSQDKELAIQTGHTGAVKIILINEDGSLMITSGSDNSIILWDMKSGGQLDHLFGHNAPVTSLCLNSEGTQLISGDESGEVIFWDISKGEIISRLKFGSTIRRINIDINSRNILVQSNYLNIYNLESKKITKKYFCIDFNVKNDGEIISVQVINKTAEIIKFKVSDSGEYYELGKIQTELFKNLDFVFHKDYRHFKLISKDDSLFGYFYQSVFKWESKGKIYTRMPDYMLTFDHYISDLAFVGDRWIVASAGINPLLIWDIYTGKKLKVDMLSQKDVSCVYFHQKGHKVVLGDNNGTIKLFNLLNYQTQTFPPLIQGNGSLVFNPSFKTLNTRYGNSCRHVFNYYSIPLKVYDLKAADYFTELPGGKSLRVTNYNRLRIENSKGEYLLSRKIDTKWSWSTVIAAATFIRLNRFGELKYFNNMNNAIAAIHKTSDNNLVAYSTYQRYARRKNIELVDLKSNRKYKGIKDHKWYIKRLCFSNTNDMLFTVGKNLHYETNGEKKRYYSNIHCYSVNNLKENQFFTIKANLNHEIKSISANAESLFISDAKDINSEIVSQKIQWAFDEIKIVVNTIPDSIKIYSLRTGKLINSIGDAHGPLKCIQGTKRLIFLRNNNICIYNLSNLKVEYVLEGHSNLVTGLDYDSSRSQIISTSLDGTTKFWDLKSGSLQATLIMHDKNYVLFTPEGYYTASKYGTKVIGYKLGTRYAPFEQFDVVYNRPDIVFKALGWFDSASIQLMKEAYFKRIRKLNLINPDFTYSSEVLPEFEITNRDALLSETQNPILKISYNICNRVSTIRKLMVYVNEVPVFGEKGIPGLGRSCFSDSLTLKLNQGINEIKIYAVCSDGFESLREVVKINYIPQKHNTYKPETWFIAIGASHYKDSNWNLTYASKDASDLLGYFNSKKAKHTYFIADKNVTKENLLALKKELMNTHIEDKVIISFSGHGILDENKDYYLAMYDVDFEHPGHKGLLYDDFMALLDSIPARKKLLFIDACHSGEFDKEDFDINKISDSSALVTNSNIEEGSKNAIVGRVKKTISGTSNSFELMQELFVNLENKNGAIVISASTGTDFAYEDHKWNNGALTYCILNGLRDRKADKNRNKKVDIAELKTYILNEVPKLTNGKQKPTFRRESYDFNWEIN